MPAQVVPHSESGRSDGSLRDGAVRKGKQSIPLAAMSQAGDLSDLDGDPIFAALHSNGRSNPLRQLRSFADDQSFTALHRAAWLGDEKVIQAVLATCTDKPDVLKELFQKDVKERTPLHVAAMQGNHEAVSLMTALLKHTASEMLEEVLLAKDATNKTAFELLAELDTKPKTYVEPEQEFREQQLWSLHKTIEITRITHSLAAQFFKFRHFWFLFIPASVLTAIVSVLSFLSTSEAMGETWPSILPLVVGTLASISVFLQTVSEQLQYRSRARMHESAALDLKSMVQDLEFQSIQAIENPEDVRMDVDVYQKNFQQVAQACKSHLPGKIEQVFSTLDDRIEESLRGAENLQDYVTDDKVIEDIRDAMLDIYILAAHEAENIITANRRWPFIIDARTAIKGAEVTVRKRLMEGIPPEQIFSRDRLKMKHRRRGDAKGGRVCLSSASDAHIQVHGFEPSLGELLVIRIAYFKGTLVARADPAAYRKGRPASRTAPGHNMGTVGLATTYVTKLGKRVDLSRSSIEGGAELSVPETTAEEGDMTLEQMEDEIGQP